MGIVYLILWYCSGHLKYVQLLLIFNFFYSNNPQFARLPPRLNSFLGGGGVREGQQSKKELGSFQRSCRFPQEKISRGMLEDLGRRLHAGCPGCCADWAFWGPCRG